MLSGISLANTTPTLQTTTSTAQPSSPRSSRLRSLSYLRTYSSSHARSTERSESSGDGEAAPSGARDAFPPLSRVASSTTSPGSSPEHLSLRSRIAARRHRLGHADSQNMARNRSATTPQTNGASSPQALQPTPDGPTVRQAQRRISGPAASPSSSHTTPSQLPESQLPSIRFVPFQDPRSPRPSLNFPTTTRTLPTPDAVIRIGRYSEKEAAPPNGDTVSSAPVGFKSKVVSRRHCEFFYENRQWFVRDVKSSSGTFLNHIRLSPPGEPSRPYAVKDGDLVQLGIDFKGGEEMVFRCVKIRILCNRGWQKSLKFNKSAHKQLSEMQRNGKASGESDSRTSTECTICLNTIRPFQALFVGPCFHTWHYKCIRPMLEDAKRGPAYGFLFTCPNCRNVADLNADTEEAPLWEESDDDDGNVTDNASDHGVDNTEVGLEPAAPPVQLEEDGLSGEVSALSLHDGVIPTSSSRSSSLQALNPSASDFVPGQSSPATSMPNGHLVESSNATANGVSSEDPVETLSSSSADEGRRRTQARPIAIARNGTPSGSQLMSDSDHDGPLTPRNDAGPFVFDGAAAATTSSGAWDSSAPTERIIVPGSADGTTNS